MPLATSCKRAARPHAYSKLEAEDPEELSHRRRRAQFLIYKAMQQMEKKRTEPSQTRVGISKLRIKIGRKLRKLGRSLEAGVGAARACVARQLKRLICCKESSLVLPRAPAVV